MNSPISALVIVDVQEDFLPTGNLPVPHGDEIIPVINQLLSNSHFGGGVYVTKDWHPANHMSFASNHSGTKPFDKIVVEIDGVEHSQTLWPDHCVENTSGAQVSPKLHIPDNAVTVLKGTDARYDSYSAFYDNAKKSQTELDTLLKKANVRTVYVCGLALDVCVSFTVMDAITLGYDTILISDACRGLSSESNDQAISKMKAAGAKIVTAADIE